MNIQTILSFSVDALATYAQSDVFAYIIMPVFLVAVVIMLLRVVKYIVHFD